MQSKIEQFLADLLSAIQIVRIYSKAHPKSVEALKKCYETITDALTEHYKIVIGIVGEEFVWESKIFFELSARLKSFIEELKEKEIEKIIFIRGITMKEIEQFINALNVRKQDLGGTVQDYFKQLGLEYISIDKIRIGQIVESDGDDFYSTGSSFSASGQKNVVDIQQDDKSSYENILDEVSNTFKGILTNDLIDLFKTKSAIEKMFENLLRGNWEFLAISSVKRHDLLTFVHSLNVSILAMFFASRLGFKKEDIFNIGIAGLFHDMGKIAISRKVIQKPTFLTDEERETMKSHSVLGAELLLQYVDKIGSLPAIVSFEHHVRYDNRGYPKLLYPIRPHMVSLIVSICDCYDALRARRSYKRDYPPENIYSIMKKEKGGLFDPGLFDKFFKFVGVYPIDTIVELTDGKIAIVKDINEDSIFSPRVEIVDKQGRTGKVIDLKKITDIKIKGSLNPLTSGQNYVEFV